MFSIFVKAKSGFLSVKPMLIITGGVTWALLDTLVVQAATIQGVALAQTQPSNCYPVPQQGGNPLDGVPPVSINPAEWIGWVLGQLCKAVATVFFTLTNQVINWGSGCSQAGINFVTQTPNYIRLDANQAGNWQLFFWDGRFIGAALLLQFTFVALSITWNKQAGRGYAGAQEAITRTFLGAALLLVSATLLDWSVELCNALNSLFAGRLSLFDPKSLQVDANGNIFNTILAMAAALASLLFVMQMATRYIYLILLQFIFPVGTVLWINQGTQGYSRLLFSSFVATLFVQPLQLAVVYITSNLKDGTRDDISLSMLFGICGLFLALGLPRVMNSVLGGNTPVGAWGIFMVGRMAAGGVSSAVRGSFGGGSSQRGTSSGGGNGGRPGGPRPGGAGGTGSSNNGGGRSGTPESNTRSSNGASASFSGVTNARNQQDTSVGETSTGYDESLRHGGLGQSAFRNNSSNNSSQPSSSHNPALEKSASPATQSSETKNQGTPAANSSPVSSPRGVAASTPPINSSAPASSPSRGGITANDEAAPVPTIYRNRQGRISRTGQGGANSNYQPVQSSGVVAAGNSASMTAPSSVEDKGSFSVSSAAAERLIQPSPAPRITRASGYRVDGRRKSATKGVNNDGI